MADNIPKLPPFRLGIRFVIGMIGGFVVVAVIYFIMSLRPDPLIPCKVYIFCMIIYAAGYCFGMGYTAQLRHHTKKLEDILRTVHPLSVQGPGDRPAG